ncbi:MAG: DeoR family transcriptional regulator [Lentisphaerae bacterium]|nr:DeoR family transcriptional regulator [Lentisphaerota bacterium]
MAEWLDVSSATARRLLADMVAKGVLRRVGDRKGTVYEAVSDK